MPKKKSTALALVAQDDLEQRCAAAIAEHESLAAEYHAMGEKVVALYNKREELENEVARRKLVSMKLDPKLWREYTAEQWEYVLFTDFRGNMERYKLAQNIGCEMGAIGFSGGYSEHTNQRIAKLTMYRDKPNMVKDTVEQLTIVLPHLKPIPIDFREEEYRGEEKTVEAVYLSIFDRGLSEYAVYFALVNIETGVYWAMQTRYHRTTRNKKFDTLEELVEYLNKTHYYQKSPGVYDDDGDRDDD